MQSFSKSPPEVEPEPSEWGWGEAHTGKRQFIKFVTGEMSLSDSPQNQTGKLKLSVCMCMQTHTYPHTQISKLENTCNVSVLDPFSPVNYLFLGCGSFHSMESFYLLLFVYLLVCFLDIQASGYITMKKFKETHNTG